MVKLKNNILYADGPSLTTIKNNLHDYMDIAKESTIMANKQEHTQ